METNGARRCDYKEVNGKGPFPTETLIDIFTTAVLGQMHSGDTAKSEFNRLKTGKSIPGLGDDATLRDSSSILVLKGNIYFRIALDLPSDTDNTITLKTIAAKVVARLP